MRELLFLPIVASAHGGAIDGLIIWLHLLMAALFVGWSGFFIYLLVRFRRSKNPKADYVGVTSHVSTYLEVAVAAIEAVLLVGLSIPFWAAEVDAIPDEAENPVHVRVIAEQFLWNVHYPGSDGIFGATSIEYLDGQSNPLGLDPDDPNGKDDVTTINQMHLPVDRPVLIQLSSKDVIHSFGVPEFRVKQDAIPGMRIPVSFTPTLTTESFREILRGEANEDHAGDSEALAARLEWIETRDYEIVCSQLCGLGHYRMRGYVTVHEPEAFDSWLEGQSSEAAEFGEEDEFWD